MAAQHARVSIVISEQDEFDLLNAIRQISDRLETPRGLGDLIEDLGARFGRGKSKKAQAPKEEPDAGE